MADDKAAASEDTTVSSPQVTLGLSWAIKRSFTEYVSRMPDGQGSVSGGATPLPDNEFLFAPDPVHRECPPDADEVLSFVGDVRFKGHAGMLFVRVADPHVIISGNRARIDIAHPYELESTVRRPLASFTVTRHIVDGAELLTGHDVQLLAEAIDLFDDVYQPGELFDDVTIARKSR